ncbi:MAG: dTDP-4-dehydrorhamnose 3,5-epimerase [Lachnospiraceae bacterium]|nr:dTDP-4-dehydrorhamnose 3,5-epimerase [Lachnospiraceae bacterium]
MGKIRIENCEIEGLRVIVPEVFGDERGYFMETYRYDQFFEAGIRDTFVQDNQSSSTRGVLRGMHYQIQYPQSKLVRVLKGRVFDVAVDLRAGSRTFGKWFGVELSSENKKMFYIPKGFAHGFLVLSDTAEFAYKCDDFYHPGDDGGLRFNDPMLGIEWPREVRIDELNVNERDRNWPSFAEFSQRGSISGK